MRPAAMSLTSWWLSTFLIILLGSVGTFIMIKEFFDPAFSDWLSPGAGQAWLGDAGRMVPFESGPNGLQTKLLGDVVPANIVKGVILGLGSLGMLTSPFSNNACQFVTCAVLPLEACFYLISIVYFALVGLPEMAIPIMALGGAFLAVSFWRLESSLSISAPISTKLLLNLYLLYFLVTVVVGLNMVRLASKYDADVEMLMRVRDYFMKDNGMTWREGYDLPNGFYIKK
jgi:hypothetical protein